MSCDDDCPTPFTRATVDLAIQNNATWGDAFQFGTAGDTSWSFTGQTFRVDVKRTKYDTSALLTLTTANGRVVVDNAVTRVLHFNVADTVVQAALPVGNYVYDLIMIDSGDSSRVSLMGGDLCVVQGVTGD